jgi:NAD(P)-dependent dehydrogenase (short-subunit alcohol dehydrogenase family)
MILEGGEMELFSGKTAVVTGAASGIGRALGEALARKGAIVVLADVNTQMVEEVAGAIAASGGQASAETLDVSDFDAVKTLVDDTTARHGRLDYIFNNAGIAVGGEVRDCSIQDWHDVLDVNLFGVINGVSVAYPIMVKQGFGHIVNTSSIEGLIPFPNTVSYVASKHAVLGLSTALRIEGKDLGVKVSAVCPGYIKTAIFHASKVIKLDHQKILDSMPDRLGMTPEDCAAVILSGVEKNKAIIMVTLAAKIFGLLHRINPGIIRWLMGKSIVRSRRDVRIED